MNRRLLLIVVLAALTACGGAGGPRPTIDLARAPLAPVAFDDLALDHLQHVLTPDQQQQFLDTPAEERAEFMRVIWATLDPTPTTTLNERRDAHYRKLSVARDEFGMDDEPGWDHRGDLLLRYGAPDIREKATGDVVPGLGLVPPSETWIYGWLGQAYRLEDARLQGEYLDTISSRRTARADIAREVSGRRDLDDPNAANANRMGADDIAHLGADADGGVGFSQGAFRVHDAEQQMAKERLENMLAHGQEGLNDRPRAFLHDYGGEKLDYFFDVQFFSDEGSGQTRVEVNTAFWAEDLTFAEEGAEHVASLHSDLVLYSMDYREAARTKKQTMNRRESLEDLQETLVLDRVVLVTDPGEYRMALSVQDSLSGDVGIFKTDVIVPAYVPGDFSISDIQLALDVSTAGADDPFRKGNLQVVPYPLGTFPKDQQIFLYFEIYGLALSPTGDALYSVEFKVQPQASSSVSWFGSSKGRAIPGVATTYDASSKSANVQEYFSLDPTTLEKDVYDLEITVRDRVFEREIVRRAAFGVQK